MKREWKPGDVAAIPFSRGWIRCIYTPEGWVPSDNNSDPAIKGYADVRPLVVIDPEDREQVERLVRAMADLQGHPSDMVIVKPTDQMQAALRQFANPMPLKPVEPTGLGAVVEDAEGHRWVLDVNGRWWRADREPNTTRQHFGDWSMVPAVRVLSEGVQP